MPEISSNLLQAKFSQLHNTTSNSTSQQADNKKSTDEGLSKAAKYAIGATALAACVVAGILRHKTIKNKKMIKETNKLVEELQRKYGKNGVLVEAEHWDGEILEKRIQNAMSLPNKERLANLEEIKNVISSDRGFSIDISRAAKNSRSEFIKNLPEDIQKAIESKDQYIATKKYIEYCDNLFHKSSVDGKNITETLEHSFGRAFGIKPHNYDLSKEYETIYTSVNTSGGGYQKYIVNSKNEIADLLNWKANKIASSDGCYSHGVVGKISNDSKPIINSGTTKSGEKYVGISFSSGRDCSNVEKIANGFTLYSPKGQDFTPAQKDLLSIDFEKLSKEDIKLLEKTPVGQYSSNYDAILSVVKTLADKCKNIL